MKKVKKIQPKIVIFTAVKNRCMLHGRVFVMLFLTTYQTNHVRTIMMISEVALKKITKGRPASPNFPVAIPRIEQIIINPVK